MNSGLSAARVLSRVTVGKYQTSLLRFSLYIGIFANALWACENLIQKIQIFLVYLVDGLLFALLIAPYVFYYFLSTRSTCRIPNATFKLPPILYLIRGPGTAVLLGAVPCVNATPAGWCVSSQTSGCCYNLAASVFQQENSVCPYLPSGFFCWWPVVILLLTDQAAHVGSHAASFTGMPVTGGYPPIYSIRGEHLPGVGSVAGWLEGHFNELWDSGWWPLVTNPSQSKN